jgi:hypothetical protein
MLWFFFFSPRLLLLSYKQTLNQSYSSCTCYGETVYTLQGAETPRYHVGTESICTMHPVWQAPQNHHKSEWLVLVRDAISLLHTEMLLLV